MQHSDPGVAKTTLHPPTRADPPQCRPFSKSALSIGRYIELDDFPSSTDHVHNDLGHVTSSKKKRGSIYVPNTLWTRSFGTTVILETLATVGIER
jgi:hypothetical protein